MLDDEEKLKIIKDMYKENLSKSITALKNQNNKSYFLTKNDYFAKYAKKFKENVDQNLVIFDDLRNNETHYINSWNTTIKSLQNIK